MWKKLIVMPASGLHGRVGLPVLLSVVIDTLLGPGLVHAQVMLELLQVIDAVVLLLRVSNVQNVNGHHGEAGPLVHRIATLANPGDKEAVESNIHLIGASPIMQTQNVQAVLLKKRTVTQSLVATELKRQEIMGTTPNI